MKEDLPKDKGLEERYVEPVPMPGIFVRRDSKLATVTGGVDTLKPLLNPPRKPIREIKAGEPVVLENFPYSVADTLIPQPPPGMVRIPLALDPGLGGAEMLRVAAMVNVRANFNFSNSRTPDKSEENEFCVLRAVQVVLINGSHTPEPQDLRQIRNIAINVSEETSGFLKKLEPRLVGHYTIEVLRDDTRAADPKEQMPADVRNLVIEKLGPPGVPK